MASRLQLVILTVALAARPVPPAQAAPASNVAAMAADFTRDPLAFYEPGRASDALRLAPQMLADPAIASDSRRDVLLTVGAIQMSQGRVSAARAAFAQILASEPWAEIAQPERVPRPAWALFCRMRDSACTSNLPALLEQGKLGANLRTIAIGDIENNSIVRGAYDLGAFARGLVHVLTEDIRDASGLKVVERQRLDLLRDEIGLSRDAAATDPAYRVKVGQLYGAQSFLFGQVMQLEKDRVRLDLRWVNTSTGEVLLAEGADGGLGSSADLFKLERKVLLELLAPKMQEMLQGKGGAEKIEQQMREYLDRKQRALPSGGKYSQYMSAVGTALGEEEAGHDDAAAALWSKAAQLNPADAAARARAGTLATQARLRKG